MNPPRNVYNLEGISGWHDKVTAMETDQDTLLYLNLIGNSMNVGTGINLQTVRGYDTRGWTGVLRDKLRNKYADTGSGFIPPWFWSSPTYWITYSEGWSEKNVNTPTGMLGEWKTTTPNATATIPFTGTGIKLFYRQGDGNGTFTTSIDGGEEETHDMGGTTLRSANTSITGLENGDHVCIIKYTGSEAQQMLFQGFQEIKPTTWGIIVNRVAKAGAAAYKFRYSSLEDLCYCCVDPFTPDLSVIMLGTNDYGSQNVDPTLVDSFKSSLQSLITEIKKFGDCLLVVEPRRNPAPLTSTIPWSFFKGELYDLADENDCALIDLDERYMDSAIYTERMNGDGVHLNDLGHFDLANLFFKTILP